MTRSTYGGLPTIPTYSVDDTDWDSFSRVGWTADAGSSALLIHDMQQFYIDSLPPETVPTLMERITALRDRCLELRVPVIYSVAKPCRTPEERGLLVDFHGMGMRDVPEHYEIDPRVAPSANDVIVTKKIYSAFFRTPLEQTLADLGRTTLVICGVYASIGCQITAFDAFMRGTKVVYVADAMLAYTEKEHIESAQYVSRLCASVHTTRTVLRQLDESAGTGDGNTPW